MLKRYLQLDINWIEDGFQVLSITWDENDWWFVGWRAEHSFGFDHKRVVFFIQIVDRHSEHAASDDVHREST